MNLVNKLSQDLNSDEETVKNSMKEFFARKYANEVFELERSLSHPYSIPQKKTEFTKFLTEIGYSEEEIDSLIKESKTYYNELFFSITPEIPFDPYLDEEPNERGVYNLTICIFDHTHSDFVYRLTRNIGKDSLSNNTFMEALEKEGLLDGVDYDSESGGCFFDFKTREEGEAFLTKVNNYLEREFKSWKKEIIDNLIIYGLIKV